MRQVQLKNADAQVTLDDQVYTWLTTDDELVADGFIDNLRLHSSGCAVFQKTRRRGVGDYVTKTLYLHKLIAEKYLSAHKDARRNLVGALNNDKLDCRLENLVYRSRSVASRKRRTSNKVGFTGVYREANRYRAVISIDGRSYHLGMFATPEDAAAAYNRKSWATFGAEGKLNDVPASMWRDDLPPATATEVAKAG